MTKATNLRNAQRHVAAAQEMAKWVWCTWTIMGERYRFQGRRIEDSDGVCWYVHVCRLNPQFGTWQRISYGYQFGKQLTDVAKSWAAEYVECGAHL